MHTLYPPVEESKSPTAGNTHEANNGDSVLPSGLREKFDAMQGLIRAQHRLNNTISNSTTIDDERRAGDKRQQLEGKKVELAVSTAVAVENELARLRNGIAELEALLAAGDPNDDDPQEPRGEGAEDIASAAAFPSLPPVVLVEEVCESNDELGSHDALPQVSLLVKRNKCEK